MNPTSQMRKLSLRNVSSFDKDHTSYKQYRGKILPPICLQSMGPLRVLQGNGHLVSKRVFV